MDKYEMDMLNVNVIEGFKMDKQDIDMFIQDFLEIAKNRLNDHKKVFMGILIYRNADSNGSKYILNLFMMHSETVELKNISLNNLAKIAQKTNAIGAAIIFDGWGSTNKNIRRPSNDPHKTESLVLFLEHKSGYAGIVQDYIRKGRKVEFTETNQVVTCVHKFGVYKSE